MKRASLLAALLAAFLLTGPALAQGLDLFETLASAGINVPCTAFNDVGSKIFLTAAQEAKLAVAANTVFVGNTTFPGYMVREIEDGGVMIYSSKIPCPPPPPPLAPEKPGLKEPAWARVLNFELWPILVFGSMIMLALLCLSAKRIRFA